MLDISPIGAFPGDGPPLGIKMDLKSRYIKRLHWMGVMRWFATGAISLGIVLAAVYDLDLPLTLLSASLTLMILANLCFSAANNRLDPERSSLATILRLFYVETYLDFLLLAWIIHLSGGITNLLVFCFVFHVIIASIIMPSRANYVLAGTATLLVLGMSIAEYHGWVEHYDLGVFGIGDIAGRPYYIAHFTAAFGAVMFTSAYISSTLGAMVRRRDDYMLRLNEELAESNQKVLTANERLIEIDRTKTYFMRMAAHEIRSPVSAILSVMHTIIEGYVDDKEQIISMLKMGAERANDALRLSKDLHDLAREKSRDLEPEMCDVNGEVSECVKAAEKAAAEKGVVVRAELPDEHVRAVFDHTSMYLALWHLIENAIVYSRVGSREVVVRVQSRGGVILVSVTDQGIGISEDEGDRIMQEFYRARNAIEHTRFGTGLGLAIARKATENMGGRVYYSSVSGEGSTFTLEWPAAV